MDNLKDYRVSLKFSEKDSDHIEVVKLLKQLGRKKSSFIVKAIKYYIANNPTPEIPGSNPVVTNMLTEAAVKSAIRKMLSSGEISPFSFGLIQKTTVENEPTKQEVKEEKVEESVVKTAKKAHVEYVPDDISEDEWLKSEDNKSQIRTTVSNHSKDEIPKEVNDLLGMLDDF